ncbi:TPA: LOW QUALITY PROTEIN: hypothetical protein N0F65_007783 [Lagenidium giganteum]|uniref:Uncharacterized protein n=1 Tax=Lagenidium giganteum TaxID=4803 RepID=A0AAV2YPN7_9STRA|nr:TPA: LOW QUALITY PROTEIN: hypothetical protein N0F65_007783 [Lagenidium giganteum]
MCMMRKLAHLWHGPFRVVDRKVELVNGTARIYPVIHLPRLKACISRAEWQIDEVKNPEAIPVEFDAALLPEDYDNQLVDSKFEVEAILVDRVVRQTCSGRIR